jgi:nucleoside-diphosphate-sugar epimerase
MRQETGRIVYASSCCAEYPTSNTYSFTKYITEREMLDHGHVALRYSNIYGKGQSQTGGAPNVLASFLRQRAEKGSINIDGSGYQTRDFIHVRDAARATIAASKYTSVPDAIDVFTGRQFTLNEVAQKFNCPLTYGPSRAYDADRFHQSAYAMSNLLKMNQAELIRFEEGIKEIL